MNYYFTLLNLEEEREMADGDGGTGTDGAVEDKIITFSATAGTFYIKDTLAVSFKDDGTFKSYDVSTSEADNDKTKITYTLKPNLVCDGKTEGGNSCESKTTGECTKIEFKIKTVSGDNKIEFEGTSPDGYDGKSLKEVEDSSEITKANDAINKYSDSSKCKASGGDTDYTLPEETQIKFKASDLGVVYVLDKAAVRKNGDEYTYYTVERGQKTENKEIYTTLKFESKSECSGTEIPQSYTATCGSETDQCKEIQAVTVKYTAEGSAPGSVVFVSPSPSGYSDIGIDDTTKTNIDGYKDQSQCKVTAVPAETVFKYDQGGYTFIIRDSDALKYKTDNNMEYTYYSGNKGDGSYGGSKYTFTATYTCDSKQPSECKTKAKADDCEELTLEVNYYNDGSNKHIKVIQPTGITTSKAETEDIKLIDDRAKQSFCKANDKDDDNSHAEAISDDKVIKTITDSNGMYYVLTKDKYYIKKDNEYQISRKLERNTVAGNNFTTFVVQDEATIYESETGYFKTAFTTDIQKEGDCPALTKDFLSLSWCNKNCNNVTAIKNRLYSENDDFMTFNYNLTLKNGTNLVYEYQSENNFVKYIGNVTSDFKIEREDIGFSVLPTILVSIVLVLLL